MKIIKTTHKSNNRSMEQQINGTTDNKENTKKKR